MPVPSPRRSSSNNKLHRFQLPRHGALSGALPSTSDWSVAADLPLLVSRASCTLDPEGTLANNWQSKAEFANMLSACCLACVLSLFFWRQSAAQVETQRSVDKQRARDRAR